MRRNTFRAERTGIGAPLGELEAVLMHHVWAAGSAGRLAADLLAALKSERPMALTTLLTTLDRLHSKGILRRTKESKAYRYFAALTQDELEQRIVDDVMGNLINRFPRAVATYLAEAGGPSTELPALAAQVAELQRRPGGVG